jgi:hypothetical protein
MAAGEGEKTAAHTTRSNVPLKAKEGVRPLESEAERDIQQTMKTNSRIFAGVYIILIVLGIGTGYLLSSKWTGKGFATKPTTVKTDTVAGSTDTSTFKDSAEGVVEKGGLDGEGSHKLIRDGGPSQTAYLISSVIDLDEYVGKKVRIWSQTVGAKKAAWLMDVGKIEILSE